ncbi:Hsp70 family protein [Streptomyces sp. NPDC056785]|uniref:Hsp70 family protein n=1 Tax=Streptomyces sp. NPDC056785 TaxID=3345944 RepID=UPI0036A3C2ED
MGADGPKVVAAVDFGTHGTGFAWAVRTPRNDDPRTRRVQFFTRFPGGRLDYPKNLTAILLSAAGETVAWGHRAHGAWAEALADGRADGLGYAYAFKTAWKSGGSMSDMPTVGGFVDLGDRGRVRELTTAYLREIRELAMAEIGAMKYAEREVRWCITVPAIWDDEGRAVMRRAAVDAGFPDDPERLLLAIEPEAAALYCYLRMTDTDPDAHTRPGADAAPSGPARLPLHLDGFRFVVIDCGGGTVDITAYESESGAGPSIALREIGLATGGHLGSEYVNQAFRDATLGERFGPAVLKRIERDYPAELLRMSRQWEHAKRTVEVERDATSVAHVLDPVRIEVPAVVWALLEEPVRARLTADAGGLPRQLVLPPEEVEALLDETVDGILDKVTEQLATIARTGGAGSGPETLLLVGGFARSEWLRERMRARFGGRHRVLVPPDPALAVLEGAVHFAYRPDVFVSRQTRYTYGFETAKPFEEGVDSAMRMYRDDEGDVLCVGRFGIAVRRMDGVRVKDAYPFRIVPVREDQHQLDVDLYRTVRPDPRYVDEDGCEEIGRLTVDLSGTVGRPLRERAVMLLFYFGASELRVEVFDPATEETSRVSVDFDRM